MPMIEQSPSHLPAPSTKRLGQLLIEQGTISTGQLDEVLNRQNQSGGRIGNLLCEMGYLDPILLREALVQQAGLARTSPADLTIDPDVLALIPAEVAMQHRVLPIAVQNGSLRLAMADPFDRNALDEVRLISGKRIERCYANENELMDATRALYGSHAAKMAADLAGPTTIADDDQPDAESVLELQQLAREPSVVNLVNLVLLEAIEARASDVHIEPFEKQLRIKYRIDGLLRENTPPPRRLHAAIVSRIKIMASMNIAERFIPQDGHITFTAPSGKVDIRVGTVPTVHGECVAMRILDRATAMFSLNQIGLDAYHEHRFTQLLAKPHGIVLVTGPTGSGKTTTLYAAINHLYRPEIKLVTVEDPVEYQLDGINQIPVNTKRGVGFANALRAILRQDPDVIMIGETRDRETADIAIRSALTGHLVFSTLHTNDAAGAVTRLIDMGVEPYLLASSLEGVLAQRLVRQICEHCRQTHVPDEQILARLGHRKADAKAGRFYLGTGCPHCRNTGYAGRKGIFELLTTNDAVRQVIQKRGSAQEILDAIVDHVPMREDGFRLAAHGHTTLEEILRVTQDTQGDDDTL